ncbi:MAG: hypothetical protein QM778_28625 [Myxococcales bacterium]
MITITEDASESEFGSSVALDRSGTRFIASAKHASYIYALTYNAAKKVSAWKREAKLNATGCVAIAGDVAVAGLTIYHRGNDGQWQSFESLPDDQAVACYGDLIAVSQPGDPNDAYGPPILLIKNGVPLYPPDWNAVSPIVDVYTNPAALALANDIVVAGSPTAGPAAEAGIPVGVGIVYVYRRDSNGSWGVDWLLPASKQVPSHFGAAVDLDTDYIIVGAPSGVEKPGGATGLTYVFDRTTLGLVGVFAPPTGTTEFGRAVALKNGRAYVGGIRGGNGAVWTLQLQKTGWELSPEPFTPSNDTGDQTFGATVALSDREFGPLADAQTLCVGAPQHNKGKGAVYIDAQRIEHRRPNVPAAIDPMRLVLSEKAYELWVEARHPHVPSQPDLARFLGTLSLTERGQTLARAQQMSDYATAVRLAMLGQAEAGFEADREGARRLT